ncbi:MAG: DUF411 domain-containing protein [Methyloceanibacter sp.]|uniref:DUF411 domain-containing protein n=1 Tax=Methyloceanibacter sp. TaxID=1965321 RepID=UPI003D6D0869
MKKAIWLSAVIALLALPLEALAGSTHATLYKNPHCSCCEKYVAYLRQEGFEVEVKVTNDLEGVTLKAGVPEQLEGCHTMFVDGYVVVGHVRADVVRKLLTERPALVGIAIPGMPSGVPGMEGPKEGPIAIYAVSKDKAPTVYAVQ